MIELYVYDIRNIPIEYRHMFLSIQGIFNKFVDETDKAIYYIWEHSREFYLNIRIYYSPESLIWLNIYENNGIIKVKRVSSFGTIINIGVKYCDGYVVYDPRFVHSINVATTISSLNNAMIIPPSLELGAKSMGLKKIADLREINNKYWHNDVLKCYEWQLNEYGVGNKDQIGFDSGYRFAIDYTISEGACSVDLDPTDPRQRDLLMKYYDNIKYYGLNMGYPNSTKLERPMVECASKAGLRTGLMPCLKGAPFAFNYSVHSRLPRAKSYHQDNPVEVEYSDDKIYLAFGLSDLGFGMLQGFYYDQWYDPFRLDEKRTVKLSWWMDALAMDVAPQMVYHYYKRRHKTLDVFYSAHVYGRIRPSDFPNLADYLERGKGKLKEMDLEVVAFSNHNKWDNNVFREYSNHLKDTVKGFIYGFGPEFGDKQCMVYDGMPWVFTTFLHHGDPSTARLVYDYIKKHGTPQFLVYGCALGYQIPYGEGVRRLQYLWNYLKEKLGNKIVNVNAVELVEMAKHCPSAVFSIDPLWVVGGVLAVSAVAAAVYLLGRR